MSFEKEDYELSTDTETEMLLTDIPMELMKENIKNQVQNPIYNNVDYLSTVTNKFDAIADIYAENNDALINLQNLSNDFYMFLIDEISGSFDLGATYDSSNSDELKSLATILYEFLVLRYKKNIIEFFYKFIISNKQNLVAEFSKYQKKKDVTTSALKRKLKDKESSMLVANLPDILSHILNLDLPGTEFLECIGTDNYFEAQFIYEMILSANISDDFVTAYLGLISSGTPDGETFLDEVQVQVRQKLIKKYKL